MNNLKKYGKKLFSMQFALVLLVLLIIACILGSVITQGETETVYMNTYPEQLVHLILALGLDDVFHAWWFALLTAALCLNLLGCNLLRFPRIIRQWKSGYLPENRMDDFKDGAVYTYSGDAAALFSELSFSGPVEATTPDGKKFFYGVRNKIGLWGAWLTHLGMLIIIVGFALGQIFTVKYTVYGVPGQTKPVEGTDYELTINSFDITLREDETVDQYTSDVTLTDTTTGENGSGEVSVNNPLSLLGMQLYQNSTGWAATVSVLENDEPLQEEILCAGEYLEVSDKPGLYIVFSAFYPDYTTSSDGMPMTASSNLTNPAYLYTVYYNNSVIGMNVLQDDYITIDDYTVIFDNPQQYTLIQLKHDPFTWLAAIGGLIICIALIISFYTRCEELWAVQEETGIWKVSGCSKKGGVLFQEKIQEGITKTVEKKPASLS